MRKTFKKILAIIIIYTASNVHAQEGIWKKIDLDFKTDSIYLEENEAGKFMMDYFHIPADFEFRRWSRTVSTQGIPWLTEKYRQYYKGIPIQINGPMVQMSEGRLIYLHGSYLIADYIDTAITCSLETVIEKAKERAVADLRRIHNVTATTEDVSVVSGIDTLIFFKGYPRMCYKMCIGPSTLMAIRIYIDANTSEVLSSESTLIELTSNADTRYYGCTRIETKKVASNKYYLIDQLRGNTIVTYDIQNKKNEAYRCHFVDNDTNWTSAEHHNSRKDDGALDAHWGMEVTYDYFLNKHNRNSYDGNGTMVKNYIHFDTNYCGAGWASNGKSFVFGDGKGVQDIYTNLGIVSHEFGHAVCQYSAHLISHGEIGAINESLSDIWAACVRHHNPTWEDKWSILVGDSTNYFLLRSMKNPRMRNHPNTYKGRDWKDTNITADDHGGIHANCGVMNHWFYLLCNGGSGINDNRRKYTVSPINIDTAARIVYRAETLHMDSTSDYPATCKNMIHAAEVLYASDTHIVNSVVDAWFAVGLGADLYVRDSVGDDGLHATEAQCIWNSPDIWIEDTCGEVLSNPVGGDTCMVCVRVFNSDNIPSSGQERLRINWAKAGCDMTWNDSWTGVEYFECGQPTGGRVTTSLGVPIPPIQAHGNVVVKVPWVPAYPTEYSSCTEYSEHWHFCLVAMVLDYEHTRGEDSSGMAMHEIVTGSNNVAWKNLTVMDEMNCRAQVTASCPRTVVPPVRLKVKMPRSTSGITDDAGLFIQLSASLAMRWEHGGSVCSGGVYLGNGRVRVTDAECILGNVEMLPREQYKVLVEVGNWQNPPTPGTRYDFDLIEETAYGDLIGGEHFTYVYSGSAQQSTKPAPKEDNDAGIKNVSPNPASHTVQVDYWQDDKQTMTAQIVVYNTEGQQIWTHPATDTQGSVEIDVTALPLGSYIVCLVQKGYVKDSKKLIVSR